MEFFEIDFDQSFVAKVPKAYVLPDGSITANKELCENPNRKKATLKDVKRDLKTQLKPMK